MKATALIQVVPVFVVLLGASKAAYADLAPTDTFALRRLTEVKAVLNITTGDARSCCRASA